MHAVIIFSAIVFLVSSLTLFGLEYNEMKREEMDETKPGDNRATANNLKYYPAGPDIEYFFRAASISGNKKEVQEELVSAAGDYGRHSDSRDMSDSIF